MLRFMSRTNSQKRHISKPKGTSAGGPADRVAQSVTLPHQPAYEDAAAMQTQS